MFRPIGLMVHACAFSSSSVEMPGSHSRIRRCYMASDVWITSWRFGCSLQFSTCSQAHGKPLLYKGIGMVYIYIYTCIYIYIAQYPVRWTDQTALHFTAQTSSFRHQLDFFGIIQPRLLRANTVYSLTFPPLSIARYSFIQLSDLQDRHI